MAEQADSGPGAREPAIVIGRTSPLLGVVRIGATVLFCVVVLKFGRLIGLEPGFWLLYPAALVVTTLYVLLVHRGSTLVLDADGLTVTTGRSRRRHLWVDLIEVGWANGTFPRVGCRPIVRPHGGPFAVPGPNHPTALGTLAVFGRARAEARSALRAACERHGVPFSDRDALMLQDPPPDSPFRTEG